MKKIFIISLSLLLFFLFSYFLFPSNSKAATLEVGAGRTYSTIQAAVNASVAGDTVLVYPGTYNESVLIPDGKQGTATSPITIKALYPARKPLDGGEWADTPDKRAVVDAGLTGVAGFYNEGSYTTNQSLWARYIIIDGFYITGGGGLSIYSSGGGILFENDDNIWIRNNVIINDNGYLYSGRGSNGEQVGNIYLKFTDNSLVQNNYFEYTLQDAYTTSRFFINNSGLNNIAEYNEGYIGPGAVNGSFAYVHVFNNSTNFIFRYNYWKAEAANGGNIISRFRDNTLFTIANNYIRSTVAQQNFIVHEQPEACCLDERHKLNNNTFYYDLGVYDNRRVFGLGMLDNSEAKNNIFYSGIYDNNSYPIGQAYTTNSNSVTIDNNTYYNFPSLVQPVFTGYTETNTQNLNPNINTATGCASSVDNNIYGANLDVSNIPYRKCDGAFYSATGKFGISVVVSDGGSIPDTTPPSAPTGLVIQ